MKKNNFIILLSILLGLSFQGFGQTDDAKKITENKVAENYDRSGLTYLLLDFKSDRFSDYLRNSSKKVNIPLKFDDNNLAISSISDPYFRDENMSTTIGISANKYKILEKLKKDSINYQLLKFWWGIQSDGSYTANKIQERGINNATDEDVSKADASKIGRAELGDAGEILIGKSYILAYEFRELKTMDEIYDAQDAAAKAKAKKDKTEFTPVRRTKNGFKGKIIAYLYKLSYNDTVQSYFFESFNNENKINLDKFNKVYQNINKPFKYITYSTASCEGIQNNMAPVQKTRQELFNKLVNDGLSSCLASFEKSQEEFRVKTPIVSTFPIRAKIGKKEGITPDRRFFVWEYKETASGATVAKRKAIIRSRRVHDNTKDELGNTGTTKFYQVGGGKIREGMIVQERVDAGLGLSLGFMSYAEKPAFILRGEYSLSQGLGYFINSPLTGLKAFVDVSFQNDKERTINLPFEKKDYNFIHATFALSKEFYFARKFHIGAIAGLGLEQAKWKDTDDSEDVDNSGNFSTLFSAVGGNFGVHIGGTAELVATIMQNTPTGDVTEHNSDGDIVKTYTGQTWTDPEFFPERQGISFDITLKILF